MKKKIIKTIAIFEGKKIGCTKKSYNWIGYKL